MDMTVSLAVRRGQLCLLADRLSEIVRLLAETSEGGAREWLEQFGAPAAACSRFLSEGFTQDDLDRLSGEVMNLMDERRGGYLPILGDQVSEQINPYLHGLSELALEIRALGNLSTEGSAWEQSRWWFRGR